MQGSGASVAVGAALTVGAALVAALATLADAVVLGTSALLDVLDDGVAGSPVTAVLLDAHARKGRRRRTNVCLRMRPW